MNRKLKLLFFVSIIFIVFSIKIYFIAPQRIALIEGKNYPLPKIFSGLTNSNDTKIKLFGVIPIKTVQVDVVPNVNLIPSGKTIGVKINIDGIMVIGFSDLRGNDGKKYSPGKESGLQEGDIIKKINGNFVKTIEKLTEIVENSNGNKFNILVKRVSEDIELNINPVFSQEDNAYKLGIWVRDSTSGIGTLTFIEPRSNTFGALGHAITDSDTEQIITVGSGEILNSNIVGVQKGERGCPGELKGVFISNKPIGDISQNNNLGIYGHINSNNEALAPIEIGMRSEIKCGPAYILCNVDGDNVEKFNIIIEKINKSSYDNKGLIIRITDNNLIRKTGGIVQGMSGSPIIQNGKIIGAVTHVFINDPTKGYGAFIELMLAKSVK